MALCNSEYSSNAALQLQECMLLLATRSAAVTLLCGWPDAVVLTPAYQRMLPAAVCRAEVLADGETNMLQSAAECATACSSSSKCNAWQWCADDGGCPTEFGGSGGGSLPTQACHLQAQKLAPGNPLFDWRPSQFVAGYNGGACRACMEVRACCNSGAV